MRDSFLVFGAPSIEQPEIDEVVATLKSGWIGTGPKTIDFTDAFRAYKGVEYAVALSSCTAALHLALKVVGVGAGDEVIVPTLTFAATANTVVHCGATPVFADCGKDTQNIDVADIKRKITKKRKLSSSSIWRDVRAYGPHHGAREKFKLKVIEDAAHAIETGYKGRKAGTIGDIGAFSFYVTKNLVTAEAAWR